MNKNTGKTGGSIFALIVTVITGLGVLGKKNTPK